MDRLLTFVKEIRTRRLLYVSLAAAQFVLGVVTFVIGVVAFTYTYTYTVGSFWAGPVLIFVGVYNKVVLLTKVLCDHHHIIRKYKRRLASIGVILNFISVAVSLTAAVVDIMAAYFLEQTDFSKCSYTSDALTASCESDICPHLRVPARTCYCCYLYEYRDSGGCETSLLAEEQTYFSPVSSCDVIPNTLQPLLYSLSALSVVGTFVNIVFLFKSTPILHPRESAEKEVDHQKTLVESDNATSKQSLTSST